MVTVQHGYKDHKRFFMIIRGSVNVPIIIGNGLFHGFPNVEKAEERFQVQQG